MSSDESCGWDEANAWVRAHQDQLPTSLESLSGFPMTYRRAIYAASPLEVRTELYAAHIRAFLESGDLTLDQEEFLAQTIERLPVLFSQEQEGARDEVVKAIQSRGLQLFPVELFGRILSTLGPPEPPGGLPAPEW